MSLHDDYLDLLRRYGLNEISPPRSPREQLDEIRALARQTNNMAARMRASEVLRMIEALDKKFDGAVTYALDKMLSRESGGPLSNHTEALKGIISGESSDLFNRIYFNEFPTGDFNACARLTANGYLCLLNTGLIQLLQHVVHSCCYTVRGEIGSLRYAGNEDIDKDMPRARASLFMTVRVIVRYLENREHRHPLAANVTIDPAGTIFAQALADSMEAFVVAHEAGHVVLGHHEAANVRSVNTLYGRLDSIARSHRDEFAADKWAQVAMLQIDNQREKAFVPKACGGLCFLTVHRMVLEVQAKLHGDLVDQDTESHPASIRRIGALRELLWTRAEEKTKDNTLWAWAILERIRELISKSSFQVTDTGIKFSDTNEQSA